MRFQTPTTRCSFRLTMTFTLDIDPKLWAEAENTASTGGMSVRQIVEEGLRRVISERTSDGSAMDDFATGGHGLDGSFRDGGWADIRDCIYGNED